ncbi:MAG: hypothetical protein M1837_005800 [Sclerophora amabilis]|nr:MAG: hypothetical protein M1837_005800 [Sclerophora amabilis]
MAMSGEDHENMSGMDHGGGSGAMGGSIFGDEELMDLSYMQKMFWVVISAVIAVATAVNGFNMLLRRQRLRAAALHSPTPAKPKRLFPRLCATVTAITREISYFRPPPLPLKRFTFRFPSIGSVFLVLSYLIVLIVFCFYKLDLRDQWQWEDVGYRTGYMTICQLPLIFLLASKRNIIGLLIGSSYERLNWLHRWTARGLFLTATIHMGFWFTSWARYGHIVKKLRQDPITQKGLAAWCILAWIVLSSMTPIRGWSYEIFVLQHLISFAAFIGVVYIHTPDEVHVWVWIPVGLFFFDRLVRALFLLYNNLSLFHPRSRKIGGHSGLLTCQAEVAPLPHHTTRITVHNPPFSWRPGQHVFLSCHSIVPLQSHPFTIASLPSDGKLEFLVHAQSGGTRRFFHHAEKHHETLPILESSSSTASKGVLLDGPYGRMRSLHQFDSVILFAGGTGATFTIPLMRDLVRQWTQSDASTKKPNLVQGMVRPVTRHIRFVWVVKGRGQISWFASQLNALAEDLARFRASQRASKGLESGQPLEDGDDLKLEMSIYVTCDETLTAERASFSTFSSSSISSSSSSSSPATPYGKVNGATTSQEPDEKSSLRTTKETTVSIHQATDDDDKPDDPPPATQQASTSSTSCCGESKPDGTTNNNNSRCCCCTTTITSEPDSSSSSPTTDDPIRTCTCSQPTPVAATTPPSKPSPTTAPLLSSAIPLFTGRPHPRNLLRKTLEQAHGETGVVICGPCGLADDVRRSVVGLSDERAVHKGTGAQGIWLWVEGFEY